MSSQSGNFDVWARVIENGKPGVRAAISREPGSDIDPAAVTDASGRVWVVWQGWRKGRAAIYAASQSGDSFSKAQKISNSHADEWNPTIAADSQECVTAAWDSYRNGNFDVFLRTATAGTWGTETPAAATPRYEAYPSLAYDGTGKLWLAYEEGVSVGQGLRAL